MEYKIFLKDRIDTQSFSLHQYEDIYGETCNYDTMVEARYIEQEEHDYIGNPLIEALPPSYTGQQVYNLLEQGVYFSPDERDKSDISRGHAIVRMKNIMHIWNKHLLLAHKVDLVIKRGYTSHELHTPKNLREGRENASKVVEASKVDEDALELKMNKVLPQMPGFSIFGISGGGKTAAIDRVLSFYPQVIEHRNYKGKATLFKQLVWVKLDASYDGNIKGICIQFLMKVDSVLKTEYARKFRRANVDELIYAMAQIAWVHKLGCLVIDEIQHIQQAKVGPSRVLNFLVTLQNMMKLPIILIGTYKALKGALTNEYRQARRASGLGEIEWGMLSNDEEYKDFIEVLFRYQWVRNEVEVTDAIVQSFYRNTAGNVARTVLIYQLCQLEAINIGSETIDEEIIDLVSQELPLTDKIIKAFRERDYNELAKTDDLYFSDLNDVVVNKFEELRAKEDLEKIKLSLEMQQARKREELELELTSFLLSMGENEDMAKQFVKYVTSDLDNELEVIDLKRKLAKMVTGGEKVPKKERRKKATVPEVDDFKVDNITL